CGHHPVAPRRGARHSDRRRGRPAGLHMAVWQGVWAPKGTPQAVIDRLDAAVGDALANPQARQKLIDLGQDIFPRDQQTPAALRALHQADIEKWWPIVKAAAAKAD